MGMKIVDEKMEAEEQVLKQGAESRLCLGEFEGRKCLVKTRFEKKYRHSDLDILITRQRMKAEAKAVERCQKAGIMVPRIFRVDFRERKIYMEYFEDAITAKEFIQDKTIVIGDGQELGPYLDLLCQEIGTIVGKMHANHIIHGDLTTSNILVRPIRNDDFGEYELIFIDFGLSGYSASAEDKAVDLYVLQRALLSTHSDRGDLFAVILDAYLKENNAQSDAISAKFNEVRARGRKRSMFG